MAPQPRLKEIWCAEIFEVSDEVHKHWNIILMQVREKHADLQAVEENNRKKGMNGEWGGTCCHQWPQEPRRCIPIHLIACVCVDVSVWCYVRKMWRTHSCTGSGVITTCSAAVQENNSSFVNECLCEVKGGRQRALAKLITKQSLFNPVFLSPPIIWLHVR